MTPPKDEEEENGEEEEEVYIYASKPRQPLKNRLILM